MAERKNLRQQTNEDRYRNALVMVKNRLGKGLKPWLTKLPAVEHKAIANKIADAAIADIKKALEGGR